MSQLDSFIQTLKTARMKINAFLRRQRWKEALIFFSFVLMSFGFWLLQSLQQDYEMEISIPVKYKNVPPNIAFTGTQPQEVIVKVKDKGSVLLNYSFGRSFVPIEVDMENQSNQSGSISIPKKSIESDIQKQMLASSSLLEFEPQQIEITYSQRVKKELPVVFNGAIHTNPGFQVAGNMLIAPATIHVYATQAVLDTLHQVETVWTDIKNANKSVTRTVALQKIDDTAFDPTNVTLSIPIEEFTEKTVEIPIVCSDLPEQYTLRTFPSVAKVTCSTPLSRFKTLSEEAFEIQISYKNLEANPLGVLPIELTKQPEGISVLTIEPEKIEFIIEDNKLQ